MCKRTIELVAVGPIFAEDGLVDCRMIHLLLLCVRVSTPAAGLARVLGSHLLAFVFVESEVGANFWKVLNGVGVAALPGHAVRVLALVLIGAGLAALLIGAQSRAETGKVNVAE